MNKGFSLTKQQISDNQSLLANFAKQNKGSAIYISSFDPFISEYVPREECHRYYVTGFTGSVAEVLVTDSGSIRLYVDGRYHEQADGEVDLSKVTVVKVAANQSLMTALTDDLKKLNVKELIIESDRTPLRYKIEFEKFSKLKLIDSSQFASMLNYQPFLTDKVIYQLDDLAAGSSINEKFQRLNLDNNAAYFLTNIDEVSWITNCRGYHLPHLSSFMARALVLKNKVIVFLDSDLKVEEKAKKSSYLEWIFCKPNQLEAQLNKFSQLDKVYFSPTLNVQDFQVLKNVFDQKLEERAEGMIPFMSIKTSGEIKQMEIAFKNSSKAVYSILKKIKDRVEAGIKTTELDLYNITDEEYRAQGAVELSFNTIAACGPNGSIIHYGASSDQVELKKNDLCLLDSGGYYHSGFATDKTRGFLASKTGKPDPKAIEIYTLVLKSLIQCQSAVFPVGTIGNVLDGLARAPLYKKGYDYGHGTGHGVGIHVHEGGVRLSSISKLPMKKGQVTSIEPGIYLPGFGGVRLENICVVEEHPKYPNYLYFRPLSYIGFDWSLIDTKLLNNEEMEYLENYEKKCAELGTSFKFQS